MPTYPTCLNCGALLPGDSRRPYCPRCLFGDAQAVLQAPLADFGEYQLLEELGQGGMGVVYRARQRSLDRVVAIKMMGFGPASSPALVERFRAEAMAAAALQHPNIVAIHEVGLHQGQHFFVMDYIEGRSLAQVAGGQPLAARRAAGYLKTIAAAVHYAHDHGILHRDLKPSNILIDTQDQPRVVDFGLARRLEGSVDRTVTGQVLGSPHYLPPEQAAGQRARVSRRTDVYGLGATLYHLLTGRPPFQAESLTQTLDMVVHADPVAPRLLNPGVPRDLETICLKCLEKEPDKRYPTAAALAEELGRFLQGQPIQARPIGPAGKGWRWCRRNPRVAAAAGAALLSLVLGLTGVTWEWRRAEAQRQRAEAGELSARRRAYISEINAAQTALKANNPARALELLHAHRPRRAEDTSLGSPAPGDLRGFEWRHLWQECQSDAESTVGRLQSRICSLAVSGDGRWLAAGEVQGGVGIWSLETGRGNRVPVAGVWPSYVTFSPDSSELVFTDQSYSSFGTIRALDLRTWTNHIVVTNAGPVGIQCLSPDGAWFAYGQVGAELQRRVVLMEPRTRRIVKVMEARTLQKDNYHGLEIVFTADSQSLIFSENDPWSRIGLWNFTATREPQYFPAHDEAIIALAASRNILATGAGLTDPDIRLWEIPSFRPLGKLTGHEDWIAGLAFSPDGQTLASASADQTVRLWGLETRQQKWSSRRLLHEVWRVCFTPDGQTVFGGCNDGSIQRWSLAARQEEIRPVRRYADVAQLAVAPTGERLAAIRHGVVWFGDALTGELAEVIPQLGSNNLCLRFSFDNQHLLVGSQAGEVRAWSVAERKIERAGRVAPLPVIALLQDAKGDELVVVQSEDPLVMLCRPGRIGIWNGSDWRERTHWVAMADTPRWSLSPDGRWLASGEPFLSVRVWDLKQPVQTDPLFFKAGTATQVAFSPDGRLLAAANEEGSVTIWSLSPLKELTRISAHAHRVNALAFSPDGRRLVTAGKDQEAIKFWEVETWQDLLTLPRERESILQVAFTTDGHCLLARNSKGEFLLWRVPSLAEIEAKQRTREGQ